MVATNTGTPATRGNAILARVREVAPLVAAASEEISRDSCLPPRVVEVMVEADVFRMLAPLEVGGAESDLQSFALIAETLGAADMSAGWCFVQGATAGISIAPRLAREESKQIFGDPGCVVAAGSAVPAARADVVRGGYVVSGEWAFASGCLHATWFDARAPIWRDGQQLRAPNGLASLYSLLLPKAQVEIVHSWPVQGMRGTGSHRYVAREVFVPEGRATPMFGEGGWADGPIYRVSGLSAAHIAFTSVGLGAATAALDEFIRFATEKTPFLARERICDTSAVQALVGRAQARVRSARAFRDVAIARVWCEAEAGGVSPAARADMRLASISGLDAAVEVIDSLYRAAGTSAVFEGSSLQRRFQDVHVLSQQLFGRPSHYENAGKMLLGLEYDKVQL